MGTARRSLLVAIIVTIVPAAGLLGSAERSTARRPANPSDDAGRSLVAARTRPNIVVLMVDDMPGEVAQRIFRRLPRLSSMFVERGIRLTNMYANDPLCCPGRAGFLTGLYSHHHGVIRNEVSLFRPGETIATALRRSGYFTAIAGKYLNGIADPGIDRTPPGWDRTAITGNGYSQDWWVEGVHEEHSNDYHTDVLRGKALGFLRAAPASKPVFLLLAPFAVHGDPGDDDTPRAAARHVGDERCADVPPYAPPSYNEADVSDKPTYVRASPKLPQPSWPLRKACEAMLSVDEMFDAVRDELVAQDRLNDTLFVLADDNGIGWGAHRVVRKGNPYAVHLAGYARWQARWGDIPRVESGHAQLTDWAPTFCEIAGCDLGPYPTGQARPDGVSLLSMLDSGVEPARDALLEEHRDDVQHVPHGMPKWWAIRTTDGRWHYVEYDDGQRELYDLERDPWELVNRAGQTAYASIEASLGARLAGLKDG